MSPATVGGKTVEQRARELNEQIVDLIAEMAAQQGGDLSTGFTAHFNLPMRAADRNTGIRWQVVVTARKDEVTVQ